MKEKTAYKVNVILELVAELIHNLPLWLFGPRTCRDP